MSDNEETESTPPSPAIEVTLCALAGCDVPITPRVGGRPRLYCSDAHRAEAHRRRVRQVPDTEALLRQALSSLESPELSGRRDAALAAVRAEMAGAVATAVRESAEALLRAEEAEASLAEREEELGAAIDEATRAKDALDVTREELFQALQEAGFQRHAMSERREEDLALVRREHACERESWDEERRALGERYEATRYELAEMSVRAEADEMQIHALAEENADLRAALAEVSRTRDELAGALSATQAHAEGIAAELARSSEAQSAAEQVRAGAAARAEAERERVEELAAEAAESHRAIEEANAEIGALREALAGERAARTMAEHRNDEMTERVIEDLMAVRELVEGGTGGGRRRT